MLTVELLEENAHLAQLISLAVEKGPIIIAVAGKPLAKLVALIEPDDSSRERLGFLRGQISVPDDFDQMGSDAISSLFGAAK